MERKPYCSGQWHWSPTRVMSLRTSVASADSESSGVYWSVAWDNDTLSTTEWGIGADINWIGFGWLMCTGTRACFWSKWHAMTMTASWFLVASRFFKATSPKLIDTAGPNIWLSIPEAKSESLRLTKARGSCRKFGWTSPGVVGGADLIMLDRFQRWGCTSPNRIHQNPQWAVKCHTLLPWSSMLMSHALAELEERKAPCFSVEFLRVASSFLGVLCVVCPFSKWACLKQGRGLKDEDRRGVN